MTQLMDGLRDWPADQTLVCGSSLGGFYARLVQLELDCRAVLLNPAVFPARDLARYIGEWPQWHDPGQSLYFKAEYIAELQLQETRLRQLAAQRPATPQQVFALVTQGDEVLDWREMRDFCSGAQLLLLPGSDHAISDFEHHMDAVFDFMRLKTGTGH
jgi:predicted esterase YcpF (UPF0227 family)